MMIDVKYNIGDSIRYIEKTSHPVWGCCPCCEGEKYIIGADGEQYECPKCEGNGTVDSYHGKPNIYYTIPQSFYHIQQEDILGKYNG